MTADASIAARLATVRDRIADACRHADRDPAEVRLLPVSKTQPARLVREAHHAGVTMVAENRVQEAVAKAAELADTGLRWSIIGPLQTNKVKPAAEVADEFQALDRPTIAEALDRRLEQLDKVLPVYVQVNTSDEPQKAGVPLAEAERFTAGLTAYPRLRVVGLMTIAVLSDDQDRVAACFDRLAALRTRLRDRDGGGWDELSMGMSGDYELAIARGATVVRVGQAIFGARPG